MTAVRIHGAWVARVGRRTAMATTLGGAVLALAIGGRVNVGRA